MKVTIKDLSEMSGFSVSTISRVLAGKGNVKKETRQAIEKLLRETNYRMGTVSSSNVVQKFVMIVVNDLSNEFYLKLLQTIQAECNAAGYIPLVGMTRNESDMESRFVLSAQDAGLAGIVLMTPIETDELRRLITNSPVPVVLVNRYLRSVDLDVVCVDNYRGGYMATEHLIMHGAKRICHVAGDQTSSASRDRRLGFQDALRDYGLPARSEDIYPGDLLRSGGRGFGEWYLKNMPPFDGIFFANDMMAAGFLDIVLPTGLRIPDDVSIVCFDDSPAVTEGPVKVTTVSMDAETLGEQAAKILLRRIKGTHNNITKVIYPPTLQERESVRPLGGAPVVYNQPGDGIVVQ